MKDMLCIVITCKLLIVEQSTWLDQLTWSESLNYPLTCITCKPCVCNTSYWLDWIMICTTLIQKFALAYVMITGILNQDTQKYNKIGDVLRTQTTHNNQPKLGAHVGKTHVGNT